MNCLCGGTTKVIDSRLRANNTIRRRRECLNCGERFSSYEMLLYDAKMELPRIQELEKHCSNLLTTVKQVIKGIGTDKKGLLARHDRASRPIT